MCRMANLHIIVRVIHILGAALWAGSIFFAAWFVIPSVLDAGPDGGKVMGGVQKRGWMAWAPSIGGITVLTGLWMYWQFYMGGEGHAAMTYGTGGIIGIVALILGGSVIGRSLDKARQAAAKVMATPEGPQRAALAASIRESQQRALLFSRVVSVMVIVTLVIMSLGQYL